MASLTNNKFIVENKRLQAELVQLQASLDESYLKNDLLRKALSNVQAETKRIPDLERLVTETEAKLADTLLSLDNANNKTVSLLQVIEEKEKELSIPRERIVMIPPPPDTFEPKYNHLHGVYSELVELYNAKAQQVVVLEDLVMNNNRQMNELREHIEMINTAVERYKSESQRLRELVSSTMKL